MAGIDEYTKLLLHCDGADESTTFTDSEYTPKTVTAVGNAQIDTAQSKFGGASGLFDGTGDYLSTPDHADWYFGTGDWTIDCWIRFTALPTSFNVQFIVSQTQDATNRWSNYLWNDSGTYKWSIQSKATGEVTLDAPKNSPGLSINTWYHMAFVRNGSNFHIFQAGTQCGTTEVSTTDFLNIVGDLQVGAREAGGNFNGHIDEFRISKGIARWTANFTPPTKAYSRIAGGGFSGGQPWIFMKDMWEKHNKIWKPNKKILIPEGI